MQRKMYGVLGICSALACWEALACLENQPAIVRIEEIASTFIRVAFEEPIVQNIAATMKILITGVLIASFLGVLVAVAAVYDWRINEAISPIVGICRNIPSITLFPILLVIYGVGDASRVFVIFWTAFPPVLLSSVRGLSSVDKGVVEAGLALGMTEAQVMRLIKLPLSMPYIVNGIRIGTGSGFVAIVVAEMLGATNGIGYMVLWTTNSFRYPETYVYILLIGFIGTAVNSVMESVERKFERTGK